MSEGEIEIGNTFKNPKFRNQASRLRTFDCVVANPMWNQKSFTEAHYDADELNRFPAGVNKEKAVRQWFVDRSF